MQAIYLFQREIRAKMFNGTNLLSIGNQILLPPLSHPVAASFYSTVKNYLRNLFFPLLFCVNVSKQQKVKKDIFSFF